MPVIEAVVTPCAAAGPAHVASIKSAAPAHTKRALFEHVIARLHQKKVIEDGAF